MLEQDVVRKLGPVTKKKTVKRTVAATVSAAVKIIDTNLSRATRK